MSGPAFPQNLALLLQQRTEKGVLRQLKSALPPTDFSSNDYLGFSRQGLLSAQISRFEPSAVAGSTGSRLISGNSALYEELENEIALFHHAPAALLYNSGYDANIGLLSCVAQKNDLILSDELIHASLIDGIRLSRATNYKFRHNDVASLRELLVRHRDGYENCYLVVESVYSMDGDMAPLQELVALCREFSLQLIVDEAHAIGLFGKQGGGLCEELRIEKECFARVYTYGKAMGCHGAAIVGTEALKQYLVNFSRSFIYTTALPEHSLLAIKGAYQLLLTTPAIGQLKENIAYFRSRVAMPGLINSESAIQCLVLGGNAAVQALEQRCAERGYFVKAIKSPTVKAGQERVRICVHAFNTREEIAALAQLLA